MTTQQTAKTIATQTRHQNQPTRLGIELGEHELKMVTGGAIDSYMTFAAHGGGGGAGK